MWQTNLIKLYCAVCDHYSTIEAVTQRQSNNFRFQFSDGGVYHHLFMGHQPAEV